MKNKLIIACAAAVLGVVSVSAHATDRTVTEVYKRNAVNAGCTAQSLGGSGYSNSSGGWSSAAVRYTCGTDAPIVTYNTTWNSSGVTNCTVSTQTGGYSINGYCDDFFIHANF